MASIVFVVSRPGQIGVDIENVIVAASGREAAKRDAQPILKGNPDGYIVDPVTTHGSRTVFLLEAR